MDIKANEDHFILPEQIDRHSAQLFIFSDGSPEFNPQSYARHVYQISSTEMYEMKAKLPPETKITGIPNYWALTLINGKDCLTFWPAPATDMFAKFRYCPAMKEI